jgi:hypothetical protein
VKVSQGSTVSQGILPPVFLWDPNDLAVFPSLAEAASWLEPIDAADGRTRAWDSTGLPLAVRVEDRITGRRWIDQTGARTVITAGTPGAEHVEAFRSALVMYLTEVGRQIADPPEWTLQDLVQEAVYTPLARLPGRYWFVAVMDDPPAQVTDGIVVDEGLPRGPDVLPNENLRYALWCRSAARSLRAAREQVGDWFRREGVAPVELTPLQGGRRRLSREERAIGTGMANGDVIVRAFFFAFRRDHAPARGEALDLIEEIVLRKWWQFWR